MFDDLLSPEHLIVLGIVVLLIFGPKRLPDLGSGFGQALRGFRDALSGAKDNSVQSASRQEGNMPQATLMSGELPQGFATKPDTKNDAK